MYHDIRISSDHLNNLPTDDVPPEIMSLVQISDDTDLLASEHDGYVPNNVDDAQGLLSFFLRIFMY